jgi:hypothetical protein
VSVSWRALDREARRDSVLDYELHGQGPLRPDTLAWMEANGKRYRPETLAHFRIGEAWLTCYRREAKRRHSIWTNRVITVPAGPVTRCYRFEEPKADRWRVIPSGFHPQWIGDLSGPEVILVEGEWDLLCAFDHGFTQAVSHTGGAGTWLPEWTPMFAGKQITICYDRDIIGLRGAAKAARALWPVAARVQLVDLPLPGTPGEKDLSDYFRLGGTIEGFKALLGGARTYACRSYSPGRGADPSLRRPHVLSASG